MSKTYIAGKKLPYTVKALLKAAWRSESFDYCYIDLLKQACIDTNSVYAMRVYYCLCEGLHDHMLSIDVSPLDYLSHDAYIRDNLIYTMLKKYPHWSLITDPNVEAKRTFIKCELACRRTNQRLFAPLPFGRGVVPAIISIAARKIAEILGDVPDVRTFNIDFGPGASYSVKNQTSSYYKITGPLDVTKEAEPLALDLLETCPGWIGIHIDPMDRDRLRDCLTIIPGSRLSFVPKTAKTDRPINIEPGLNKVLQKGFGSHIRQRLKQFGLNLNRSPDRHRHLAQRASVDGSLATVDLSSASDMISYAVVMNLLPFQWFEVLDSVRCSQYCIENTWYSFHKFSAMGNGYTFELESLIFYALSLAACEVSGLSTKDVSVFGDDIIIPTDAYGCLEQALDACGFLINKEKSFCSGPFRESCGGDFYNGISVRGFYFKHRIDLASLVRFRNYLYRTGFRYYFPTTWSALKRFMPQEIIWLSGPDDGTDDHIIFNDRSFSGRRFNFVSEKSLERKVPKRWFAGKAFLLYRAQFIRPDIEMSNLAIPDSRSSVVSLSCRYETTNTNTIPHYLRHHTG